ncbi:MAG: hypothetical protein V4440_07460 [Pseudomonadota bacterium]
MLKNPFRPHTTFHDVYELMKLAYADGYEREVKGLTDKHGDALPRSSLSMAMAKIKERNLFPAASFYTRTTKAGLLVLGVRLDNE